MQYLSNSNCIFFCHSSSIIRYAYNEAMFELTDLIPFALPVSMCLFGNGSIGSILLIWLTLICSSSFFFALTGLNAGHHHPDVFHDGDEPR